MIKISIAILVIYLSQAYAHFGVGKCLESPIVSDFLPAKYAGDWYEIIHYPAPFEEGIKCVRATYKALNATALSVHNYSIRDKDGSIVTTDGLAVIEDSRKPNQISVFFASQGNAPQPYNVWMTDYTTYALVYSCKPIVKDLVKFETAWILSRTNTLDGVLVEKLLSDFKGMGVDITIFETSNQTNCTY